MYERGRDTRLGGEDSEVEILAKRMLIAAYERARAGTPLQTLAAVIDEQEQILRSETDRKLREGGHVKERRSPDLPNER